MEEGGGNTSTFPFEVWNYRYIESIGENVTLEFVDTCQCGDYHFTTDKSEKDALPVSYTHLLLETHPADRAAVQPCGGGSLVPRGGSVPGDLAP